MEKMSRLHKIVVENCVHISGVMMGDHKNCVKILLDAMDNKFGEILRKIFALEKEGVRFCWVVNLEEGFKSKGC